MDIISLIVGLGIGMIAVIILILKLFSLQKERGMLISNTEFLQSEKEKSTQLIKQLNDTIDDYRSDLNNAEKRLLESNIENKHLSETLSKQKEELLSLQEKFKFEFEQLAQKLLEEKSKKFTEVNEDKISSLLNPLKEKINLFEQKIEHVNKEQIDRNATLIEQIRTLTDLQNTMTAEAKNLANALKHDTKVQGDWGELILENILEKSGLRKDQEYFTQNSFTQSEGGALRPDILVQLPENKHIIIDSKVSLTAYERLVNAETEEEKNLFRKQHIASIKSHINELSNKKYQEIEQLKTPDFVLLFIPIEPAFMIAMQEDQNLYLDAFNKNIVIVSNSTLLATLRTIASIWKQEYQNKNSLEIARQAGRLFDKFVGFTEDLKVIGNRINQTQKSYEDAMSKLQSGRGNLINSSMKLKKLGVQSSKKLDEAFDTDTIDDNDDE